MHRLLPAPGPVAPGELLAGLRLAELAPDDRPYTVVNFVASADGRATLAGRSGGLSDPGDRQIFRALRGVAEALLVGTGTLRTENYGRVIKNPELRRDRQLRGLAPEPILATTTRGGELPTGIPLFGDPEARVVVYSMGDVDLDGVRAQVEIVRLPSSETTMAATLAHLRRERGIRLLLCEGGPTLFSSLLREQVADELFLTVSGVLAGADELAITADRALVKPLPLDLKWVLGEGDSLYLRYGIRR